MASSASVADKSLTEGFFSHQIHETMLDAKHRRKVLEEIRSGEAIQVLFDLKKEIENASPPTLRLTETLAVHDSTLDSFFKNHQIWAVTREEADNHAEIKTYPVLFAEVDNPRVFDFNIGTESEPEFDAWETAERIGAFLTLPTHQVEPTGKEQERSLYAGYLVNNQQIEYPDLALARAERDPYQIRAGAIVLFSRNGQNKLIAVDSRDLNAQLGDQTRFGQIIAIESFSLGVSSQHEI